MAEKKKTTPKKTTAPKKVAGTVKKKTVAKKTTARTTTKKPVTSRKASVAKKAAVKKLPTAPKTVLSFSDWKSLVSKTFALFPSVWWRVASITFLTVTMMMVVLGVGIGIILMTTGGIGVLANEYANLSLGGTPSLPIVWMVGGLGLVFLTLVFVISFIANIATVLTVKNILNKNPNNPLKVFFAQSWRYFGSYAWLSVRLFWYIVWPVLVGLAVMALSLVGGGLYEPLAAIMPIATIVGTFILIGLFFWRAINIIFVTPVLIAGGKNVSTSLQRGIALVSGNWWLTLWGLFLFFVPIYLIQGLLEAGQGFELGANSMLEIAMSVVSTLLSVLVFAPLSVTFIYLFMLHLSKRKKINL